MGLRRLSRELALKALYSYEFQDEKSDIDHYSLYNDLNEHLQNIAHTDHEHESSFSSKAIDFSAQILKALIFNLPDIDDLINEQSDNWTIDRLAVIDRQILRLAVCEMVYLDTPHPIIINEAIEIAKKYSTENSGKFVNGILDAINGALGNNE